MKVVEGRASNSYGDFRVDCYVTTRVNGSRGQSASGVVVEGRASNDYGDFRATWPPVLTVFKVK